VVARIMRLEEAGQLKDRLDMAWQSIKSGLVQGLSIGFQSVERSYIDDSYAIRFIRWLWLELSVVTIPANADASITTVRGVLNPDLMAASGQLKPTPSGVPDRPKSILKPVILREPVRVHPVRVIIPGRKEARSHESC
jgi:hypothetical protein